MDWPLQGIVVPQASPVQPPERDAILVTEHAFREFAQGIEFVHEEGKETKSIGELIEALTDQLQKQVRTKPHPLNYATLISLAGVIFSCGILFQRVSTLEEKVRTMPSADMLTAQISDLRAEQILMEHQLEKLQDSLDKLRDTRGR